MYGEEADVILLPAGTKQVLVNVLPVKVLSGTSKIESPLGQTSQISKILIPANKIMFKEPMQTLVM